MNMAVKFFHDSAVKNMGMRDENMPRLRYRELHGTDFRQVLLDGIMIGLTGREPRGLIIPMTLRS